MANQDNAGDATHQNAPGAIQQGRYLGENGRWSVQMRVQRRYGAAKAQRLNWGPKFELTAEDREYGAVRAASAEVASARTTLVDAVAENASNALSADLRLEGGTSDARDFYLRVPALSIDHDNDGAEVITGRANWLDQRGATGSGHVEIRYCTGEELEAAGLPASTKMLNASFSIGDGLPPLPPGYTVSIRMARVSGALRDVGVVVSGEQGVRLPKVELRAGTLKIEDVLLAHGVDVKLAYESAAIPLPPDGAWAGAQVFDALNEQLQRSAQLPVAGAAWEVNLMLLSRTDEAGLLGVMFDYVDDFPRQGAAVFVDEIQERFPRQQWARRVLTTAIHELGHTLNLTHRFARDVGRADSNSFMNYDWLYRGKGGPDSFWQNYCYRLDPDELDFVLHGPRDLVIPGGAPFGSARYWLTGEESVPALTPDRDFQLWLTAAETGTTLHYGEPLFLQVSVRNVGAQPRCLPRHVLDVKAGMLDLSISRRTRGGTAAGGGDAFVPFMRRCYAVAQDERVMLGRGESLHDNVNLAFGAAGSPFAEPGDYVVTPELTLYDDRSDRPVSTVRGESLAITVLRPANAAENRDAEVVFRTQSSLALALGGSTRLSTAADDLLAVADRRSSDGTHPDGLSAAVYRMRGLQASREKKLPDAKMLLDRALDLARDGTFDPHTRAATRRLMESLPAGIGAVDPAPQVSPAPPVASPVRSAAPAATLELRVSGPRGHRSLSIPGRLLSRRRPDGPEEAACVLVRADSFDDRDTVEAVAVVIIGRGGLTERLAVRVLDRFGDGPSDDDALALAVLAHGSGVAAAGLQLDLLAQGQDSMGATAVLSMLTAEQGQPAGAAGDAVAPGVAPPGRRPRRLRPTGRPRCATPDRAAIVGRRGVEVVLVAGDLRGSASQAGR